jgi:hypothetical protein
MMPSDDRRMFAPLRYGEPISPENKVVAVLAGHEAGATIGALADTLLRMGVAIGSRAQVTTRIGELLDELERTARVERIPDGRYRVVRSRRGGTATAP